MRIKKYGIYYCNNAALNLTFGHDVVVRGYDRKKKKYKVHTVSSIADYNNLNLPLDRYNIQVHRNNIDGVLKNKVIPIRKKDLGSKRFVGIFKAVKYVNKEDLKQKKYCDKSVLPRHLRKHIN